MSGVWSGETTKLILAPMVRIGTLPMRLLCLKYGANLVYTPEIVDKSIIGSVRQFNPEIGCWDYVRDGKVIFRTHPSERGRLIFQIGSASPELAVQAARTVAADVAGVDLNCGCPKRFSVQGGMGAALLADEPRLLAILSALVAACHPTPVSCKIRVHPDLATTVSLCRRIAAVGVQAIAIHCRTPHQTPHDAGSWLARKTVAEALRACSPCPVLVANGDLFDCCGSLDAFQTLTAASPFDGFMFARAAMHRPFIFAQRNRHLPREALPSSLQVAVEYLQIAVRFCNPFHNTKFVLLHIFEASTAIGKKLVRAKTYADLGDALAADSDLLHETCSAMSQDPENDDLQHFPYVPDLQRHGKAAEFFGGVATIGSGLSSTLSNSLAEEHSKEC